jgi:hypothetical protein
MQEILNAPDVGKNIDEMELSKDEFIQKTRLMLQDILDKHKNSFKDVFDENKKTCQHCGGFGIIEEGGNGNITCRSCKGSGIGNGKVFDIEGFMDYIEFDVMFGKSPFLELLFCKIKPEKKHR